MKTKHTTCHVCGAPAADETLKGPICDSKTCHRRSHAAIEGIEAGADLSYADALAVTS